MNSTSPATTSKVSSCDGWTCGAATAPFEGDEHLDDDRLAAGLRGRGAEDERLARDVVRDRLAWLNHGVPPLVIERDVSTVGQAAYDPLKLGLRRV